MKLGAPISSGRRQSIRWLSGGGLASALLAALASVPLAQDVGFEGPSFSGAGASTTPTESKPQNKLWFNDGAWWGILWSNAGSQFRIHRLNFTTHVFTDTGVNIENRTNAHSDALWDGTKLYIATHIFTTGASASGNPMRLYRYSYNTTTDVYSLDAGFPVVIGDFSTESLTIAKDSAGIVWAAWTQANRVRIAHSTTGDNVWSASIVLPTNTTNLNADDLCAMTSFGGNKIGIAWSDQVANAYRFSTHTDGQPDTTWTAIEGISSGETDDHINLAIHSDGRVFLAGKNAGNNLLLYSRSTAGAWTRFIVTNPTPILTRPCVIVNEGAATIHVFATGQDTGEVFEKSSPLSTINFGTGAGTIRMRDSSTLFRISNPTATKDNWTNASGLVILAHHDTTGQYWHHEVAPTGGAAPVANFSATPTTGAAPLNVAFTDTSTGTITARLWNFGDGGTSTATNPSRNYTVAGSYTVTLTVTGPGGSDPETKTNFIVVTPPAPVANFTATPTTGVAPLNVAFTDTSTGTITARLWNFGDGGTSTATNPSRSYAAAGSYTVTLTVTGPGGSDPETKTNFIVVTPPAPVANFTATPTTGVAPLNVAFTDTSTGTINSRLWSFGDGGTSTATNPSRNYTVPGSYTVTLTVTGPGGSDPETKTNFIVVSHPPPVANFTATPTTGVAPLNVAFTDTSTGTITARSWNFGDGGTSTATNPSHNYPTPGSYTVTLTVTGPGGSDPETKTNFIVVNHPAPVANFTATPTSGVAPLNVAFTDTSTGTITARSWSFGDGGTSTATNPSHNYPTPGNYTVTLTVTGPGGTDPETKTNFIVVNHPAPVANFTATPTTGTAPLNVSFTDTSTGTINSRAWSFGDGGTSTATNPSHNYATPGSYTVTLTVTGPGGSDPETKTNFIVVSHAAPVANFTGTPTSGPAPLNVSFSDTSTGTVTARSWDFGDGGTSSAASPSHNYTTPGSYTVTLNVTGPGGSDGETKTSYIVVSHPAPVADFGATPTSGSAPLGVTFTDASTGNITARSWSFGDGGTSSATSPEHEYTTPGTYTVSLTVTGPGGSDTETKTNLISVLPPPPVAAFSASPTTGEVPLLVTFTNTSTGSITSYAWDFGDGGTSTATHPTHTYTTAGFFTVTLTANGPGGSDVETKTTFIIASLPPPPAADFSATPLSGEEPLQVSFTDLSTGVITAHAWDFGDGSTSSQVHPTHTYQNDGTYTVSLTVTGPGGSDGETKTNYIVVTPIPAPVAEFSATPLSGEEPLLVGFTDLSTGNIASRLWNFGDGGTSTATNPTHTYSNDGTYTVTLTVTGPGGSDGETKTDYIVVTPIPAPVADFSATPLSGQEPLLVGFTNLSSGNITSYSWDFGDGGTSSATNPSHTYQNDGTYTVTLTATGPGGSDGETKVDFIVVTPIPAPVADFSATPLSGQEPLLVNFTNLSSGNITSYSWSFGDGGTSTATNPSHTYQNDGTYTVTLTATGPGGSDGETKVDYIVVTPIPAPVADFSATPLSGQEPLLVNFTNLSSGNITSYSWSFGDGGTSTATNPSHTYTNDGTYTVTLTTTGPGGSDGETKVDYIVVTPVPAPVADFSATPTTGAAPLLVGFTDASSGSITSRQWSFGDGGTSTAVSPTHTYSAAGTYTVTLTVNGPGGSDSEVKTDLIVVSGPPAPVANFTATPTTGTAPLVVAFTNTSTGNITSRTWNFGDGGTSTATNPSHTYSVAGSYTVTLTVNGPNGSDSEIKTDFIVVSGPPAPVANFTGTPTTGTAPLNVVFTNTSTGNITSRLWNFGDGGTSTSSNPSRTYSAAGSYTVTLTVNGPGGSDSEIKTNYIVVSAPAAPVANFTASPTSGTAPLSVAFTNTSTGNITSRTWNFGDGGTSTASSPSHTYSAAGSYTVTLTVNGPGGSDSEVKTNYIVVSPPSNNLVLGSPSPGAPGNNTIRVTGATPNSVVGFYMGQKLGSTLIVRPGCPAGVTIGLAKPWVLLGTARANGSGVATLGFSIPSSAEGKIFHFQTVDQVACRASNLVTKRIDSSDSLPAPSGGSPDGGATARW